MQGLALELEMALSATDAMACNALSFWGPVTHSFDSSYCEHEFASPMRGTVFCRFLIGLLVCLACSNAQGTTYVVLWFDTEDYIDPISDDAALRIANDLTELGVH